MTVDLSTVLDAPPERVWDELNRPALLCHVARPLVAFAPLDPPAFPERWAERAYRVRLRLFGLVPIGWQVVGIERPAEQGRVRSLRDDGRSAMIRRWDHRMTVEPLPDGRTRYTDHLEIEAGVLTPAAWAFARLFYAHRQRRWRALVARGFRYDEAAPEA